LSKQNPWGWAKRGLGVGTEGDTLRFFPRVKVGEKTTESGGWLSQANPRNICREMNLAGEKWGFSGEAVSAKRTWGSKNFGKVGR